MAMFLLRVAGWENDDEHGNGGSLEVRDRYFSSLPEVLSRLCWPWLDGVSFGVYERQPDGSWLLYYHSI